VLDFRAHHNRLTTDQYPYREDGQGALRSSVEFLQGIEALLDAGAMADLSALVAEGYAVKSTSWLSRKVFGKR
jgi:hypothetical protein